MNLRYPCHLPTVPVTAGYPEAELKMVARDPQGAPLGGILADLALGRLEVQVLYVPPAQRSTGLGPHRLVSANAKRVSWVPTPPAWTHKVAGTTVLRTMDTTYLPDLVSTPAP